jgi:uncharacterized protein
VLNFLKTGLQASIHMLCTMLLFASCLVHAELVAIPELSTRVTDLTQTLSAAEQTALEQKLAAVEAKKGSQIAVLIVPSTQHIQSVWRKSGKSGARKRMTA